MFAENTEYEILTPSGWQDFRGVTVVENKITYRITLNNGVKIEPTSGHYFFTNNVKVQVADLKVGSVIDTTNGPAVILEIKELPKTTVYDIIEVGDVHHQFIVNSCLITKNCDEFAFVQPNIAEEFWTSISPTLATGGKAIITSTPNSDEDTFANIWKEANNKFDEYGNEQELGLNGFSAFTCHWSEHPDRDDEWAREEQGRIGEERFRREYNCEFLIYDETLINSITLSNMDGADPIFKMGQTRWYKKVSSDNLYLVALDPCLGTGGDFAAIEVFELPSFKQVAEWHHNTTPIEGQIKILRDILKHLQEQMPEGMNNIYWSIENNSVGESGLVVIKNVGEENFPGLMISEPVRKGHVRKFRKGFNTTHGSKISACARLKHLIETTKMEIYSKTLISELKTFIATGFSFKAKNGDHDDLVSALLLLVRMSGLIADWDPRVFETLSGNSSEEEFEAPLPIFISSTLG